MILDSCILIDISRQRRPALDFVRSMKVLPALSVLTVTEVLRGVRGTGEQQLFETLFAQWQIFPVTFEIAVLASQFLRNYGASHALDIIDATIAATAQTHKLEFATLNIKHFPMFPGLSRPY